MPLNRRFHMKQLIVIAFLFLATPVFAGEWVNGHWKDTNRDGIKDAYVRPYMRSVPDNNSYNNYSSKPNYNPYTGKEGTVNPYNVYQPPVPPPPYNPRLSPYR